MLISQFVVSCISLMPIIIHFIMIFSSVVRKTYVRSTFLQICHNIMDAPLSNLHLIQQLCKLCDSCRTRLKDKRILNLSVFLVHTFRINNLIRPYIFHSTIVSDTDVNWPKAIISLFLNNYLKCSHKTSKHALNVKQNYSKTFLNISFHF